MLSYILAAVYAAGLSNVMYYSLLQAYEIRLHSITEYGRVIHEFDPYFNYRATEYLWQHGWKAFRTWFDYRSWYPLGRPVGTTIYPGMQVTSCWIKQFILPNWSINDICCFVPAWFGVLATLTTALIAYECSVGIIGERKANSKRQPQAFSSVFLDIPGVTAICRMTIFPWASSVMDYLETNTGSTWGLLMPGSTELSTPALESAVVTAWLMSMVPAHLMRSVAGGYDNESIAMFAMTLTFYCWVRSLRGDGNCINWFWSIASGVAYFYMVAAWGGYVFVLNLIGVHASVLVLLGRYSTKLHRAYTCFYLVGTTLATQVPVVGWTPLKSLEQLGPLIAFVGFQLIEFVQIMKRKHNLNTKQTWILRLKVFAAAGLAALAVGYFLADAGYFGPISSRVRGLFVKHTKTGNPLVDSVAEHQPASAGAYLQYLDVLVYLSPVGFALTAIFFFHDSSSFLIVYALVTYYFSAKMVRLILLTAPIASIFSGIAVSHILGWGLTAIFGQRPSLMVLFGEKDGNSDDVTTVIEVKEEKVTKPVSKGEKSGKTLKEDKKEVLTTAIPLPEPKLVKSENGGVRFIRIAIFAYVLYSFKDKAREFHDKCHELSHHLSHPTIIQKGQTKDGSVVVVDDYREAYWWLRDNTDDDARIMAWWDYGYQIAGIGNRTTIADGNTWNHEHIALLGRALTSPLKEGHRIARHLADYVLLWTGGGGDDVAKSPHMRRIANSVYRFLCPGDPTCRSFGMDQYGRPTPSMKKSLLFQLHQHRLSPDVQADKNRFKLVYQTKHDKVRIFKILSVSQESKKWSADPANRLCDAPGSWFCPGQYPPALQKILSEKKDFAQLEDFNKGAGDEEYTKQYLQNLNNPDAAKVSMEEDEESRPKTKKQTIRKLTSSEIAMINDPETWDDSMETTMVWEVINKNNMKMFREMLIDNPELAHIRSKDGRGPIWWAHEYGRVNFVTLLKKLGVSDTKLKDVNGVTPISLTTIPKDKQK